jgi:hypothetical protein
VFYFIYKYQKNGKNCIKEKWDEKFLKIIFLKKEGALKMKSKNLENNFFKKGVSIYESKKNSQKNFVNIIIPHFSAIRGGLNEGGNEGRGYVGRGMLYYLFFLMLLYTSKSECLKSLLLKSEMI